MRVTYISSELLNGLHRALRSYYRLQKFLRIYGSMSAMLMTFPLAVSSPERLKLIQRLKFVR